MKAPISAAAMTKACAGFGTWSAGWLCQDAATPLIAAFGGVNLPETTGGGSPVYQVPGPLGDKAVRVTVLNTGWAATSTAFLDVGTGDLCGVAIVRVVGAPAVADYVLSKNDFAGGLGFTLQIGHDGHVALEVRGTSQLFASTPAGAVTPNDWTVIMWGMDKAANTFRAGAQSLTTGVQSIGALGSVAGLGTIGNTALFRVQRSGTVDSPLEIAGVYMGVGVGAAAGLPSGIEAALASFCTTIIDAPVPIQSTLPAFDYVAHALSRLPHMYRSSDPSKPTNTEKDIAARLGPANALGAAMRAVLTQRNIDTAVGAQLTVIGRLVGRKDRVPDDEIERRYCRAQIAANKSDGVIKDILTVARAVIGDGGTIVNDNTGVAAYVLRVEGIAVSDDVAAVLVELVLQATSDGVRAVVQYSSLPPSQVFRFDVGPGFDVGHLATSLDEVS